MTDIVLGYPYLIAGIETTVRFPPPPPAAVTGDGILMIDGTSFILMIDGSTIIGTGH